MRTALETVSVWRDAAKWLESSAEDFLSIDLWNKRLWWPDFWDTPAFAQQLLDAHQGLPNYTKLQGLGAAALAALRTARRTSPTPVKTQRFLYQYLVESLYPDSVADTFRKRLSVIAPLEGELARTVDFQGVRNILLQQTSLFAVTVLKSLANAWTTSSRTHESKVLPCILGCPNAQDTQEHYLRCERLWRLVKGSRICFSRPFPKRVLARLGLLPLSDVSFRELVVASRFYHYVKFSGLQEKFLHDLAASDIRAIAEASKRAMQAVRFSVSTGKAVTSCSAVSLQ